MEVLVEEQGLHKCCHKQEESIKVAMPVRLSLVFGELNHQPAQFDKKDQISAGTNITEAFIPSPPPPPPHPTTLECRISKNTFPLTNKIYDTFLSPLHHLQTLN